MLVLIELVGPFVAEHVRGGTPWHPHHIAERYGLMVIIALGEGLLGTTAALGVLIDETGWSLDIALLGLAGVALPFGMWWIYFVIPCGDLLQRLPLPGRSAGATATSRCSARSSPSARACTPRRTCLEHALDTLGDRHAADRWWSRWRSYFLRHLRAVRRAHPHPRPVAPTGSSPALP